MTALVELEGVDKAFGDFRALQELSLSIRPGEIVGLLGHNGAGKTTTMKLILGLITPTAGRVRVFGVQPSLQSAADYRRRIGFLPENVNFYQQLTGHEVLRYFARLKGIGAGEVPILLARVGLDNAANRKVKAYSKGMRQRLGLAQALLGEPQLLMLDEPTAGLDPTATREFYGMLDELRERGTTVLLSSHMLPGVEGHIDRALILGHGRLLAAGGLDELRKHAALPIRIRARGLWPSMEWSEALGDIGMAVRRVNGSHLEFTGPESGSLNVLRVLLATGGVEDIKMFPPSLEELYAFFNRSADRPGEKAP